MIGFWGLNKGGNTFRRNVKQTLFVALLWGLTCMIFGIIALQVSVAHSKLKEDMWVLANILGNRSVAALVFRDHKTAEQNLATAQFNKSVDRACLFDNSGALFAEYRVQSKIDSCPQESFFNPASSSIRVKSSHLVTQNIIRDNKDIVGHIIIYANSDYIFNTVMYLLMFTAVLAISIIILVITFTGQRLKLLMFPLEDLHETARQVAQDTLSTKRVKKSSEDEIGELVEMFNTMLDNISSEREALLSTENTLRKSEKKYRALVETTGTGYLIVDDVGRVIDANPEYIRLAGYQTLSDILGKSVNEWTAQHDQKRNAQEIEKCLKKGFISGLEIDYVHSDGEIIPVEINAKVVETEDGLHILSLCRNIIIRKQEEKQLARSLEEKELLLREIYHRTKNNMYVISSMLRLQSRSISDAKILTIFQETENRIRAMSLVHEKLYQSQDLSNLDLGEYLGDMVKSLVDNMMIGERIKVDVDVMPVPISIDHAVPFGLVVNEIVTNSLKHAFPDDRAGIISIKLQIDEKSREIELLVRDNGIGIPDGFDFRKSSSFGLQTAVNLVEKQLNGTYEIKHNNGTEFFIRFIEPQRPRRI